LIDILIFALTIAPYGAADSQLEESSDNSITMNEFARRIIRFASIIFWMRAIHKIRIRNENMAILFHLFRL